MKKSRKCIWALGLLLVAGCAGPKNVSPEDPVDALKLKDYDPVSVFVMEEHHPLAARFSTIDMHSHAYRNDEAGIRNDVPRLFHFKNGRCLNPHSPVTYQVADVNTGADIHYNKSCGRICFVSHRQPLVEFYNDSLQLVHSIKLPSAGLQKTHNIKEVKTRARIIL